MFPAVSDTTVCAAAFASYSPLLADVVLDLTPSVLLLSRTIPPQALTIRFDFTIRIAKHVPL
ncbi:hypothetical protein EX30DRAFT_84069 [Ascodesmis nigricans]|uniref:Uncharacterized protein n=1 Tax=Ascodesmis nigricans TaxID=341454 RepID=A0A4S2N3J9_9PEZI|nr:hypothetical protein EX30DRAFT_84069 [Ascodesmis nigricans]